MNKLQKAYLAFVLCYLVVWFGAVGYCAWEDHKIKKHHKKWNKAYEEFGGNIDLVDKYMSGNIIDTTVVA